MIIIQIFGGAGVGKSTLAAHLYATMNIADQERVYELCQEFAKELAWENREEARWNRIMVLGEQYQRLMRLDGKVDVALTDSPLLLNSIYGKMDPAGPNYMPQSFYDLTQWCHHRWPAINIVLTRSKKAAYETQGRFETYDEALKTDEALHEIVGDNCEDQHTIYVSQDADINDLSRQLIDLIAEMSKGEVK